MKNEKEKKNITKSIKVSQNQYDIIMQKAAEKNMNFSEYVVDCAVHGNQGITPQIAVKVQEIANTVTDLAERLDYSEYTTKDKLLSQADELDELFHTPKQEENYKRLFVDADTILKGAGSIWEYLK